MSKAPQFALVLPHSLRSNLHYNGQSIKWLLQNYPSFLQRHTND